MEFLAILAFYFHSYCISKTTVSFVFLKPLLTAFKCILHAQYEKSPIKITTFFTALELIWLHFCPKDHTHFSFFFADFQWIMLGDSINMNNLCCNPAVLKKKLVKRLKNCSFWPNLHERGPYRLHPKWKTKFFFSGITKSDHQVSETSYLTKVSYVLAELWIFFNFEWCFLTKKCHF